MALLLDEPRHANVIAVGPVEVYCMEKVGVCVKPLGLWRHGSSMHCALVSLQDNFIKLLGPVRDVLSRQMRIRVLRSVPLLSRLSDAELDQVSSPDAMLMPGAGISHLGGGLCVARWATP
jgi:hypothetical protein